jgi:hypothetical protein
VPRSQTENSDGRGFPLIGKIVGGPSKKETAAFLNLAGQPYDDGAGKVAGRIKCHGNIIAGSTDTTWMKIS